MSNNYINVPYGQTVHGEDEINAVNKVLRTSTQMGKNVYDFEYKVASLFDKKFGVMVNSGSSALLLANAVSGLPEGSEVITPVLTFATTVSSLIQNKLVPNFVDVTENTYCIDCNKIESMITPNTKGICVPNLLGNIANWKSIRSVADRHGLFVLEDSADAINGQINGNPTGSYTDISITSFYGSHVINCAGNGGMLCLNDPKQAEEALLLRSWGRSSSLFIESEKIENRFNVQVSGIDYDAKFLFSRLGYNLEPSELGAAFGLVQLKNLDNNINARIRNFAAQRAFFSEYQDWVELPEQTPGTSSGWLAYPMCVKDEAPFSRKELQIFLEKRNIQTRVIFTGNILRQPGFKDIKCKVSKDGYPMADKVMKNGILLACHHGLNDEQLAHTHQSFRDFSAQF